MCETCEEPRWSTWLLFNCSNYQEHPDDAEIGIAVITNGARAPEITAAMEELVCSLCGAPFEAVGEESALTPCLTHDLERFKSYGYATLKDDEVIG
ncbi:MAG: hypothetical protein NTX81_08435 [Candidatus Bathyarchaeota archaeon]|jgi:hypothetical protein|nr:hypothetical protein [Candidatus Bathyarchaeota archaeon]